MVRRCDAVVMFRIQDRELASCRIRPQRAPSVVSNKTLYPHCLVLVSTQEDLRA